MDKKQFTKNQKYFQKNQVGMIKRCIQVYLDNQRNGALPQEELENQRQVIFSFLGQFGLYEGNDKNIFEEILAGTYDLYFQNVIWKKKNQSDCKLETVKKEKTTAFLKQELLLKKLKLMWQKYDEQCVTYEYLFRAFQDYFENRLDIYSEQITQQEVCTYTKRYLTRKEGYCD